MNAREATHGHGVLPNLIVIGALKCGTTSLHYYLNLHPQISMSSRKELNFFIEERNWSKGVPWYRSHFRENTEIHGESSPGYTAFPRFRGVPERMASLIPDAKLLYVVRDPIERIVSHYVQSQAAGHESRGLPEALSDFSTNYYIKCSQYGMQMERYLNYFPPSNILVVQAEELAFQRAATLKTIFHFFGVEDSFFSKKMANVKNQSVDKRRMGRVGSLLMAIPGWTHLDRLPAKVKKVLFSPISKPIETPVLEERLKRDLQDFMREDINRFRKMTARSFETWSV
jgi:hypothetical protein